MIGLWESIGSVVLIALLLERPVGSVQTEASRLQLPRRVEDKDRHRKKWTGEEDGNLLDAIEACRAQDGRIRIIEVSRITRRSIDAIVNRLSELDGGPRPDLRETVWATEAEIMEFGSQQAARNAPVVDPARPAGRIDTRNVARRRACLTCEKPFWSPGAYNRICPKCKSSDMSDWD